MTPDPIFLEALLDELSVRELCRVIDTFDAAGLEPLVFKGAAVAHTHYADSWRRPRRDADVLIAPAHRADGIRILGEMGYERLPFVSGDLISYQCLHVRTGELGIEHSIDLHWRIANPQLIADMLTHRELI